MIKMVFMLKRRVGMSVKDFIERYESGHVPLGERHVPDAARYVRRYLEPVAGPFSDADSEFDVITEVWFDTEADYTRAMARLADPAIAAEIAEDEEYLFDRSRSRAYLVYERESEVGLRATSVP